jgi:hypothetical protein
MNIELSQKQFIMLLRFALISHWTMNISEESGIFDRNDFMEMYDFLESKADEFNVSNLLSSEQDKQDDNLSDFENEVQDFVQYTKNDIFWGELENTLSIRDVVKKYGKDVVDVLGPKGFIMEMDNIRTKYHAEFLQSGLENVIVKGINDKK